MILPSACNGLKWKVIMSRTFHRRPAVQAVFGLAPPTIYQHVSKGLLTRPVNLGLKATGWPVDEIDKIVSARVAGKGEVEIKALVARLMAARQQA